MPFNSLTARALALGLAAALVAAPAVPAQPADMRASVAQAAADAQAKQDLRSPDARDQRTIDPATRPPLPGPPTWPVDPKPINQASTVTADTDSVNWATIGLGIAGSLLAVGGLALLSARRTQRLRVTV